MTSPSIRGLTMAIALLATNSVSAQLVKTVAVDVQGSPSTLLETREQLRDAQRQLVKASRNMEQLRLQRVVAAANADRDQPLTDEQLTETRSALSEIQRQLDTVNQELERLNERLPDGLQAAPGQRRIERRVLRFPHQSRPMVGITMQSSSERDGVRLRSVTPGGPADEAGLRSGDEILAIDDQAVSDEGGVDKAYKLLRGMKTGEEFVFRYRRDGTDNEVRVVAREIKPQIDLDLSFNAPNVWVERFGDKGFSLTEPDDPDQRPQWRQRWGDWADRLHDDLDVNVLTLPNSLGSLDQVIQLALGWSGLQLVELNDDLSAYFDTGEGALVVATNDTIDSDLKAGDVIVAIDGEPVSSPREAMRILGRLEPETSASVTIIRRGDEQTIELSAPKRQGSSYFYRWDSDGE